MVIEQSGACIVPATVEVVGGQGLGRIATQTVPCNVWGDGGITFEGLRTDGEMRVRASAPGYAPRVVTAVPATGGLVFEIVLSKSTER